MRHRFSYMPALVQCVIVGVAIIAMATSIDGNASATRSHTIQSLSSTRERVESSSSMHQMPEVQVLYSAQGYATRLNQRIQPVVGRSLAIANSTDASAAATGGSTGSGPAAGEADPSASPSSGNTGTALSDSIATNSTAAGSIAPDAGRDLWTWILVPVLCFSIPVALIIVYAVFKSIRNAMKTKMMDGVELKKVAIEMTEAKKQKATLPGPSPLVYLTSNFEVDRPTRAYGFSIYGDGRTGSIAESQLIVNPLMNDTMAI